MVTRPYDSFQQVIKARYLLLVRGDDLFSYGFLFFVFFFFFFLSSFSILLWISQKHDYGVHTASGISTSLPSPYLFLFQFFRALIFSFEMSSSIFIETRSLSGSVRALCPFFPGPLPRSVLVFPFGGKILFSQSFLSPRLKINDMRSMRGIHEWDPGPFH